MPLQLVILKPTMQSAWVSEVAPSDETHFSSVSSLCPGGGLVQGTRCRTSMELLILASRPNCSSADLEEHLHKFDLVVVIPSARHNFQLRKVLRETWFGNIKRQKTLKER